MSDLSQQVQLQQQLNSAIQERNALLEQQNRLLTTQSSLAGQLNTANSTANSTQGIRNMTSALRDNRDEMRDSIDDVNEMKEALDEAADAAEDAAGAGGFGGLGGAFSKFTSILSGGLGVLKGVGSAVLGIGASLAKAAFSIFTFPFKLFSGLIDLAQQGGGGRPLAEAYEEVRDVFGDIKSGPGKQIIGTFKEIRAKGRDLAGTGLKIKSVFGYGRQGLAEMLKDLNELGKEAGDNFARLAVHFKKMRDKAIVFQRGLGLSKQEFGELAAIAESRGQDIEKYMTNFSATAVRTAKAFGLGVKDVAKGMKELNLDVENFGHLGPEAFAPITVYARKLGLEIKDMAGVMGKFAGFADTTEAASKMSQAFGMNVDAMQLMAAQNPAEKIDILRSAFYKTGKDLKSMTYQQRQYLATLTGLEGKSLEAAFALDKQGVGYANIKKSAEKANKKQMDQKKVLKELSKGIKRLIQTMSAPKAKGFFDAFVQGFEKGVMRSKEFRDVMIHIRSGLRQMRYFGMRVGKMFVKYFPGIKKMLEGIAEFLEPGKFRRFIDVVEPLFKTLFETGNFKEFGKQALAALTTTFEGDGIAKVFDGFMEFSKHMSKIIGSALEFLFSLMAEKILPAIRKFFKKVNDDVKSGESRTHLESFLKNIDEVLRTSDFGKAVLDIFAPIINAFQSEDFSNMIKGFESTWKEMEDTVIEIAEKIGEAFFKGFMGYITVALAASFGPALLMGGIKMFGTGIAAAFKPGGLIFRAFTGLKNIILGLRSTMVSAFAAFTIAGSGVAGAWGALKIVLGGVIKAFWPLQVIIGAINGLMFAFDENVKGVGQTIAAFGLGFLETFTFGLGSATEAFDFYFDTNVTGQKIVREQQDNFNRHQQEWLEANSHYFDQNKEKIEALAATLAGASNEIDMLAVKLESKLDPAQKTALTQSAKILKEMQDATKKEAAKIDAARDKAAAAGGFAKNLRDQIEDAKGWAADSDAKAMLEGASLALKRELQAEFGTDAVQFEGDYMVLDDDVYQDRMGKLNEILNRHSDPEKAAAAVEKQTKAFIAAQKAKLKGIDIETLKGIRLKAAKEGLTGTAVAGIDKALEARLRITAEEMFKNSDKREQRIQHYVEQQMKKIDKQASAANTEKKLDELTAQKRLMDRMKTLTKLPEQMKKIRKQFGNVSVESVKIDAKDIVSTANAIMDGISEAFKGVSISEISQKSSQSLTRLKAAAGFVTPVVESMSAIQKGLTTINGIISKTKNLHKRVQSGAFAKSLSKVAKTLMGIPGIIVGVFNGMNGDAVPQWAKDAAYGMNVQRDLGVEMGELYREDETGRSVYDAAKKSVSEMLMTLSGWISPIMGDINELGSHIGKLSKLSSSFPKFTKKSAQALADKVGSASGAVNTLIGELTVKSSVGGNTWMSIGSVKKMLRTVNDNLTETGKVLDTLRSTSRKAGRIRSGNMKRMVKIGRQIEEFTQSMALAKSVMSQNEMSEVKPIFDALAQMGGGKVTIDHNLPATQLKVNVYISAKALGNAVSKVDLKPGAAKRYIQTGEGKTNK